MHYTTKILHGKHDKDPLTGALSVPVYHASTFNQKDITQQQTWNYSRSGNPTRKALEETLADLEHASYGYAFASGMAAISAAIMSVCRQHDHILVTRDLYGGTYRFLNKFLSKFGVSYTFVDTTDPVKVAESFTAATKILFLESPSNPLLKITDLSAMASIAQKHGCITMIDNTFLSPYFCRPLDLGIDISIHSGTKFLGGHSDLLCGAVMTNNGKLADQIYFVQNCCGGVLSPQDSWLLLRGIRTLSARMDAQQASAVRIAQWLCTQPWVETVFYPGLASHPGHEILKSQASGFGCVVSARLRSREQTISLLQRVKLWAVAVSLGGVESILSYPWRMSHTSIPEKDRIELGITDTVVRLSVGLEAAEDLIEDLAAAAV